MPQGTQRNVLIVEDENSLAQLYKHHLQHDYNVTIANTGKEALVELTSDIDLMFLDRRMGEISGDEVLNRLELEMDIDCRVVMVTAVDPELDIIDLPIEGYISKPVDDDDLKEAAQQAFLMERYDNILSEYYEAKQKRAAVEGIYPNSKIREMNQDDGRYTELVDHVEELEDELTQIAKKFPDREMAESFFAVHSSQAQ
jgi:CheY-like chemotaxis protein